MSGSGNSFGPNALGGAGNGFGPNRSSSVASSGGSQGPINPATLSPAFWLQHGVGVTHIAGKVTSWLDSSGSGDANKNATGAGTGVARPTYNAADSAWNNLPTVSLNSSLAEYLYTGTWSAPLVDSVHHFSCSDRATRAQSKRYTTTSTTCRETSPTIGPRRTSFKTIAGPSITNSWTAIRG